MSQGPSIIQRRIRQMKRLPINGLLCRSCGAAVLVLALIVASPAMAQDATTPEGISSPAVKPDATGTQKQEAPSVADDEQNEATRTVDASEVIDLLTDDLNQHWKTFSSAPATPDAPVWKVVPDGDNMELILICSGEPKGFLYTTESCTEFELTLEWKFPKDLDGNSGVLVYTQDEPRIWPTSMQVQLHQPKAGSVFPSGDAMSDQPIELERDLARPVDTWNEGKIVSRGGHLSVEVNGRKAGEVSGAKPSSGSIALQSEGSVVHFRRIRLRKLHVTDREDEDKADAAPGDDTNGACNSPVISMPPGLSRWSFSERGGVRTQVRRNSKTTLNVQRHRRQ